MSDLNQIHDNVSDSIVSNRMRLNELSDEVTRRLGSPETETDRQIQRQFSSILSYLPSSLVDSIIEHHEHVLSFPGRVALVRKHGFIVQWKEKGELKNVPEDHICAQTDLLSDILEGIESATGEFLGDRFIESGSDFLQKILDGNRKEVLGEIDRSRNVAELLEKSVSLGDVDEGDVPLNLARAVCAYKGLLPSQVREIATHIRGRMWAIEQGANKIVDGLNQFKSAIGGARLSKIARSEG
jgi:hypothetical protein